MPDAQHSSVQVTVLAHNEEARIAACLASLPVGEPGVTVTVVVNGSTDRTADIVRAHEGVELVEYEQGGKARSWNRFVLDGAREADVFVFVDGDAQLVPGSVDALARALAADPRANAASGLPMNGRRVEAYRRSIAADSGLFGDCYALAGDFVRRMRERGIRLPDDIIGEDGLVRALACTDLGPESGWSNVRVVPVAEAGFWCEPNALDARGLRQQAARMVNYSVRHFQNRIVSDIMRGEGPAGLPRELASLYGDYLPRFRPRLSPLWFAFDRKALARMRERMEAFRPLPPARP
ncbi:glycosyltransferase family A protein [Erythrobacter sp.]|uniref:glycosyltransferase family A protein n=1 Tax=Erythrobacter sp. TaxID=1042 RepID=UPI001425BF0F|nr:glycosyltransferase family A protein [Erythrobacter sp.]QIQ87000.1 MAG: glycosyltransferase family 2 protein [Erythrobacter sp.]